MKNVFLIHFRRSRSRNSSVDDRHDKETAGSSSAAAMDNHQSYEYAHFRLSFPFHFSSFQSIARRSRRRLNRIIERNISDVTPCFRSSHLDFLSLCVSLLSFRLRVLVLFARKIKVPNPDCWSRRIHDSLPLSDRSSVYCTNS